MADIDPADLRIAQAYQAGYRIGHADALAPHGRPSRRTKLLAAGTFIAGLAGAGSLLLYARKDTREVAMAFGIAGALLVATGGAVSVLLGNATPRLGLRA